MQKKIGQMIQFEKDLTFICKNLFSLKNLKMVIGLGRFFVDFDFEKLKC